MKDILEAWDVVACGGSLVGPGSGVSIEYVSPPPAKEYYGPPALFRKARRRS